MASDTLPCGCEQVEGPAECVLLCPEGARLQREVDLAYRDAVRSGLSSAWRSYGEAVGRYYAHLEGSEWVGNGQWQDGQWQDIQDVPSA